MQPLKFGSLQNGDSSPYIYSNLWEVEQTTGPPRLVIAPSANHVDLTVELTRVLPEPFWMLYVLVASRVIGKDGRYQTTEPFTHAQLEKFLHSFQNYLEFDGRHHLWICSVSSNAQVIYDNHNVLYAYGPLDKLESVLVAQGLSEGKVQIPFPHAHNYNAEFDRDEERIMDYTEWLHFPLEDSDD